MCPHIDNQGNARMVDISAKSTSLRTAIAEAQVQLSDAIVEFIHNRQLGKGDLLTVANIAGIQGAKKCAELIPLCHPLPLDKVTIEFSFNGSLLSIQSTCRTTAKTGVEMEALTAASIAALTIYDMCKSIDKHIVIKEIRLLSKSGGKSGTWPC